MPLLEEEEPAGGLAEISPSPVDESLPSKSTSSSYFPPSSWTFTSSSNSRSHSTTSRPGLFSAHTLGLVHKYATWAPSLFLSVHYFNTCVVPLATQSVSSADDLLLLTRPFYQSSMAVEALLIGVPVGLHVASGLALRMHRRRVSLRRHGASGKDSNYAERRALPWPKLSPQSALGYALVPLLVGHVYINRIHPLRVEGGSSGVGLRFVAHGFAKHPLLATLGYAALVLVGTWHVVGGWLRWLRLDDAAVTDVVERRRRSWWARGVSALVAAAWMVGGLGVIGRGGRGSGWEAKGWDRLYRSVPLFGVWLS